MIRDEALRTELLRRMHADQHPDNPRHAWWVRRDNTKWLKVTVEQFGWPGHSVVGEDGAHAAWLIAQHSDHTPRLQDQFLTLLAFAVEADEASPQDLAYLTDRVLIHSGQPQAYGTQLNWRDDEPTPHQIIDPELVDERRAQMGLCPLSEYLASVRAQHLSTGSTSP